jgi:hypothetical protein
MQDDQMQNDTSRNVEAVTVQAAEAKLDRLIKYVWQQEGDEVIAFEVHSAEDWGNFPIPDYSAPMSDEMVNLSKEVAEYYRPLIEKLVEASIITLNIIPQCAVHEVSYVMPEEKSYFNEGKILLFVDGAQVNSKDNTKLKKEYQNRLGKFVQPEYAQEEK